MYVRHVGELPGRMDRDRIGMGPRRGGADTGEGSGRGIRGIGRDVAFLIRHVDKASCAAGGASAYAAIINSTSAATSITSAATSTCRKHRKNEQNEKTREGEMLVHFFLPDSRQARNVTTL